MGKPWIMSKMCPQLYSRQESYDIESELQVYFKHFTGNSNFFTYILVIFYVACDI